MVLNNLQPLPVVFIWPGLTPDTCLRVFDKTFHVSSIVLKMHSGYFRKLMDSPDNIFPVMETFKYEYVTVVDADGIWALEPRKTATQIHVATTEKCKMKKPQRTFEILLSAIHGRRYSIEDYVELHDLTCLADFYCALRVVSLTLCDNLVYGSDEFCLELHEFAREVLVDAYKLRNRVLFQECIIHVVGVMAASNKHELIKGLTPDVNELIVSKVYAIRCRVERVFGALFDIDNVFFHNSYTGRMPCHQLLRELKKKYMRHDKDRATGHAVFIRKLYDTVNNISHNTILPNALQLELRSLLDPLVYSGLKLVTHGDGGAGESQYWDRFLCTMVSEHELPWDLKEMDW